MKTIAEFSGVIALCLVLTPGVSPQLLDTENMENTLLGARLFSLNGTDRTPDLPWDPIVELLFSYITPHGKDVSEMCNNASIVYKDALNNVSRKSG